jgi:hypothetical protein
MNEYAQYLYAIDLVIALTCGEGVVLALFHRLTGRGIKPSEFLPNLFAGLGLMLALRRVLSGGSWSVAALYLLIALIAHLVDLGLRWSRAGDRSALARIDANHQLSQF